MRDYLERVGTNWKVKKDTLLEKDLLHFLHSTWGTAETIKEHNHRNFFPGPQPVSIERRHFGLLSSAPYVVCEKTDGVRHVLMATMFGGKKVCVLVNRAFEMTLLPLTLPKKAYDGSGTIIDGELVQSKSKPNKKLFMVYDAVCVGGGDVRGRTLIERLTIADREVVSKIMRLEKDQVIVAVKKFYNAKSQVKQLVEETHFDYETDGIVFTPVNDPVKIGTHDTMFKWKPLEKNTIDFLVRGGTLYLQEKGQLFREGELVGEVVNFDEKIVECQFVEIGKWKPIGVRTDKTYPNSRFTYYRTLVNIKENIKISELIVQKSEETQLN
jgi:hypothetical protein